MWVATATYHPCSTWGPAAKQWCPVVIGGYNDLADISDLIVTTEITPNTGEKVKIIRTSDIDVADGALAIGILNEEFCARRHRPGAVYPGKHR